MCSIRNTYHLPSLKISSIIYFKSGNDVSCFLFMTNCYTNSVFAVFQHLGRNNGSFKSCHNCSGFVLDKFFLPKVAQTVFFLSKNENWRSLRKHKPL